MQLLNYFLLFSCIAFASHSQQECFAKKSESVSSIQAKGPLSLSVVDPIKNFQSGSHTILNSIADQNKNQRYTCFNITFLYIPKDTNYEVVASVQNIENYQDKQGLDFSVRFSPNPTLIEGLFIMSKTAVWTSVGIHYIITARQDFRVGTFVPETAQFLPCGKESSDLIINHKIIKGWNASKNLIFGLPFLSGIRTMDNEINVVFNKSMFDPATNLLQIPVKFEQVQFPIEYLLISYLIVTMDSQIQITNIYDLDYIPTDINVFVGMTGVKTAPQIESSATPGVLKSTISPSNILNSNKFREFFSVQGLVIQSQTSLDLLFSDGNVQSQDILECVSSERCVGYDGYMKYYQNEGGHVFHSQCILCQKFASYNNKTLKCECRQLYVRINGSCIQKQKACLQDHQVFNQQTGACQCANGYTLKSGKCVSVSLCPPGYTNFKGTCYKLIVNNASKVNPNPNANTKNTTTANQNASSNSQGPTTNTAQAAQTTQITTNDGSNSLSTASSTQSVKPCVDGMVYNQVSKACQCPPNTFFNDLTNSCVACKVNEVWNNKSKACQCMDGSFKIKGICDFCSQNAFFNGDSCQCLPGYLGNGKICRPDPSFLNQTLGLATSSSAGSTPLNQQKSSSSSSNLSKEQNSPQSLNQAVVIGTINLN